jgi:hypothetical protein
MIEYIDVEVTLPPPVKKQIWNGEKFVPMTLYRTSKKLTHDQIDWLRATYGVPGVYMSGQYWDYANSQLIGLMDDKVYMMFTLKWAGE